MQSIDSFHEQENRKCDDYEIDQRVDKASVSDDWRAVMLGIDKMIVVFTVQRDEKVREVDPTHQLANRRHDDVVHQRRNDSSKCSADNDTDREVHNVPSHCKCFKFLQHRHMFEAPVIISAK